MPTTPMKSLTACNQCGADAPEHYYQLLQVVPLEEFMQRPVPPVLRRFCSMKCVGQWITEHAHEDELERPSSKDLS